MKKYCAIMGCFLVGVASPAALAQHVVVVHIHPDGLTSFDDGPEMGARALRRAIRNLKRERPQPNLHVEPEKTASYSTVARFLSMLSKAKYGGHLGFVGEAAPN